MVDRGFRYHVDLPRSDPATAIDGRDFPYVVDDIEWARRHGYGFVEGMRVTSAVSPGANARYFARLSPARRDAFLVALRGRPPGNLSVRIPNGRRISVSDQGCLARAQGDLYGDTRAFFRSRAIVDNLRGPAEDRVRRDARYRAAVRRWATCLHRSGTRAGSPEGLRRRAAAQIERLGAHRASALEQRLAVLEAKCARRSSLAVVATRLDRRYRRALRTTYRAEVETLRRLRARALVRARGMLTATTKRKDVL